MVPLAYPYPYPDCLVQSAWRLFVRPWHNRYLHRRGSFFAPDMVPFSGPPIIGFGDLINPKGVDYWTIIPRGCLASQRDY
jgi:hypothetical protein